MQGGNEENDNIDIISSLPDDARTHILSFLSTREAVQTCILSKRWRNTWASVLDMKFYIKEFGLPALDIFEEDMAVEFVTKFEQLVKSVLEKRKTSYVNIFRLWLNSGVYWPRTQAIEDYIGDVMKLEPRECSVKLCSCENLNLNTDLIFACTSLIYLQLWLSIKVNYLVYIKLNSVNLPSLNTLNLDGVIMSNGSFKKLLLGCPMLEELVLVSCYIGIMEICSNSLKKFVLCNCYRVLRLQISTPNLLYLDISVSTREIMLLNMSSLVHSSIYLPDWYDQEKYVTWGTELIHSLSNVESLRLEFDCFKGKVRYKDYSDSTVFNNLKHLKVLNWGLYDFDLALYVIHHSPNLQELTLENEDACVTEYLDEETTQEGPRDAFVMREFLKTVRIIGFENDNGYVDRLINKLLAHVKIIGEIIV